MGDNRLMLEFVTIVGLLMLFIFCFSAGELWIGENPTVVEQATGKEQVIQNMDQVSVMMAKNTIFEILILVLFVFNGVLIFLIFLCFKRYETEKSAARLYKEANQKEGM